MAALRARATRAQTILMSFEPRTWEELADLHQNSDQASETEEKTLALIASFGARAVLDPLSMTRGFPSTWSQKLQKSMRPLLDVDEMARQRQDAWNQLVESGKDIPAHLVAHGLPSTSTQPWRSRASEFFLHIRGCPAMSRCGALLLQRLPIRTPLQTSNWQSGMCAVHRRSSAKSPPASASSMSRSSRSMSTIAAGRCPPTI